MNNCLFNYLNFMFVCNGEKFLYVCFFKFRAAFDENIKCKIFIVNFCHKYLKVLIEINFYCFNFYFLLYIFYLRRIKEFDVEKFLIFMIEGMRNKMNFN